VVRTGAGLLLVAWFVLPIPRWLLGELKSDFSEFLVGGLMIVIGRELGDYVQRRRPSTAPLSIASACP
jgi:hypothetical protein